MKYIFLKNKWIWIYIYNIPIKSFDKNYSHTKFKSILYSNILNFAYFERVEIIKTTHRKNNNEKHENKIIKSGGCGRRRRKKNPEKIAKIKRRRRRST